MARSEQPYVVFSPANQDPTDRGSDSRAAGDGEDGAARKPGRIAREILAFRRRRDSLLSDRLFADPAWDMLLYLVVAEEEGRRSSISRLCRAAAVPTTTALRWIGVLESQELVQRTPHPSDGRIFVVSLTETGSAEMQKLLSTYRLRPA